MNVGDWPVITAEFPPWHNGSEFINDAGGGLLIFFALLSVAVWFAWRKR